MTATRRISLLESLDGEWLKLPLKVMQDVGPAVQTLGGLLGITVRETFTATAEIARKARLPVGTVRKHLVRLHDGGWIVNEGRDRTRAGHLRRTATLKITRKTKDALAPFGYLPWWACCQIRKVGRLPWSAKAVLAVVMARLCSLKKAVDDAEGQANLDPDDMQGSIDNMGGEDRWRFSLKRLTEATGLDRKSVVIAKRLLNHRAGIVRWAGPPADEGSKLADLLEPNWQFNVVVTDAPQGGCFLAFDKGVEK